MIDKHFLFSRAKLFSKRIMPSPMLPLFDALLSKHTQEVQIMNGIFVNEYFIMSVSCAVLWFYKTNIGFMQEVDFNHWNMALNIFCTPRSIDAVI